MPPDDVQQGQKVKWLAIPGAALMQGVTVVHNGPVAADIVRGDLALEQPLELGADRVCTLPVPPPDDVMNRRVVDRVFV